jgi:hypothetical protein
LPYRINLLKFDSLIISANAYQAAQSLFLDTTFQVIGPLSLDEESSHPFFRIRDGLTDVADFTLMFLVFKPIPALAWDRVSDRFTKFMRARQSKEIQLA